MKKVILALVVLGSFPLIRADENAELEAQRREHARKLYHAVATGDQICIDRIMKGSSEAPALQFKAMVDQLEIDRRKGEKSLLHYVGRAAIWAFTGATAQILVNYLKSISSSSGRPSAAGR